MDQNWILPIISNHNNNNNNNNDSDVRLLPLITIFCVKTSKKQQLAKERDTEGKNDLLWNPIECVSRIWTSLAWLHLVRVVRFSARADFHCCPAASKNNTRFKSDINRLKNNHLALFSLNLWHAMWHFLNIKFINNYVLIIINYTVIKIALIQECCFEVTYTYDFNADHFCVYNI